LADQPRSVPPGFIAIGAFIALRLIILIIGAIASAVQRSPTASTPSGPGVSRSKWDKSRREAWDKRLEEAEAIVIETENHSPEWYQIAAELTCDEILRHDAEVRRKEARRRVRRNEIEAEYQAMASYAESY